MRQLGLAGRTRGTKRRTTIPADTAAAHPDLRRAPIRRRRPEPVVDRRHHLRRHLVRVRLHGVRHRRVLPAHRRLARRHHLAHRPRPGRLGDGHLEPHRDPRRARPPLRPRRAIPVDPLHRTPRRRRRRHLRRLPRRLLRQRHGRVDHRPLQERTDHHARPMAHRRRRRTRHPVAGSTGGTPPASTPPSATSHPTSSKPLTTLNNHRPTRPESTKPSLHQTRGGSQSRTLPTSTARSPKATPAKKRSEHSNGGSAMPSSPACATTPHGHQE